MTGVQLQFADDYASMLESYLADEDEAWLHRVYALGRSALDADWGLLEVAEVHQTSLDLALSTSDAGDCDRVRRLGHGFLLEVLSPFELAQRQSRLASAALRHLNETLESEARRIAYALHDEAGQLLVSADLAVAEVGCRLPTDLRALLEEVRAPLRRCANELRRMSHDLRPPVLDDLGLIPALEFLASSLSSRLGIPIAVTGSTEGRAPGVVEVAVYRIVQEALLNVARHAGASRVYIEVQQSNSTLSCTVRDDGAGFDSSRVNGSATAPGLGLVSIRERVDALGGAHRFVTAPGHGAALLLTIPIGGPDGHSRSAC